MKLENCRPYVWLYSRAYGLFSRAIHRLGFHYAPVKYGVGPAHYAWCHWCGLRGSVITEDDLRRGLGDGYRCAGVGTKLP